MHFASPWAFLLLVMIPVMIGLRRIRFRSGTVTFSTIKNASKSGRSLRQRLIRVPDILRSLAVILLVVALARPQSGREEIREISRGIAIEMVVDRSGSMGAEQEYRGERMNRLETVKRVLEDFVMGDRNDLKGRPNDLIGMIVFARYADTVCPLTLAHGALPAFLKNVNIVQTREEDGTAIGDALALAAARLKKAEDMYNSKEDNADSYEIKSKVIILLSDGENNAGKRTPLQAAELAAEWGIKIHAIAIGGGDAVTSVQTPFGVYKVPSNQRIDTRTLKAVAEKTGGIFRKAEDGESLKNIYLEIDSMEKSEIESIRFVDYHENYMWFALAGLVLLILETLLGNTVFRRIP